MFSGKVLAVLTREGLDVSRERLVGARKAGIFRPKLKQNEIGFYEYTPRSVDQFRTYLYEVRTGPRPTHQGPGCRERAEIKREEKAERLRKNDAAIAQLEAIAKKT